MLVNSDIDLIIERTKSLWNEGKIEGALEIIRTAYENSPSNAVLAFEYGHMLGQLSSGKPSELKSGWRSESIDVLAKLCEKLDGIDPIEQWKIRRHFFLYSGQHLQNRSLGYEEIKRGNHLGVLSVGFGCLHHAIDLVATNSVKEARHYAFEAKDAFKKLLEIDSPKYGRLLAYALALALLGKKQEAIAATYKAAKLLCIRPNQLDEHNEEMNRLLRVADDH